ncbi:MAG: LLM class flavin-dependent oxidoreductase [Beijerinckiaceae bacterium]|jgi:luciferase family oxidoreductase group 1|nr:LLM class flavin-dependent oxidoreductase [Beijerinckiaceae bacterium]MDO9441726.1 LLM class flavin-dependent oxidoreductase [Beijerinckiaceae bacterium]
MIPLSVLDLAPVAEGSTPAESLTRSRDLARHAEQLDYNRFWLAEHHNMIGIASAATSVVIGHVAAGTSRIRVGSGGVMLPNHSPLVIAEQFGTLATLFPGRIDLGVGRAPGTDQRTLQALRREYSSADRFPQDVLELRALLGPAEAGQLIQAVPGAGTNVPIWILGSSLFGAKLAGLLGLPYAFASHFAPGALEDALDVYRASFEPSEQLQRPYAMVGVNVVAAETAREAKRLFTSVQQSFTRMQRGTRGLLPPPIDDIETYWSPAEKPRVNEMLACSFVGDEDQVAISLDAFIRRTGADELIVASAIHDHDARLRSYTHLARVRDRLGGSEGSSAPKVQRGNLVDTGDLMH